MESCCNNPEIILADYHYVCKNCGTIDYSMDVEFAPPSLNINDHEPVINKSSSRTVLNDFKDYNNKLILATNKYKYSKLAKINNNMSSYQKSYIYGITNILRLKDALNIPNFIIDYAKKIFEIALQLKISKGYTLEELSIYSIFCSARVHGFTLRFDTLLTKSHIKGYNHKLFTKFQSTVLLKLNKKISLVNVPQYISYFIAVASLPLIIEKKALELYDILSKKLILSGKEPKAIATACIFIASKYCMVKIYQAYLIKKFNIPEATFRNRVREFNKVLKIIYN